MVILVGLFQLEILYDTQRDGRRTGWGASWRLPGYLGVVCRFFLTVCFPPGNGYGVRPGPCFLTAELSLSPPLGPAQGSQGGYWCRAAGGAGCSLFDLTDLLSQSLSARGTGVVLSTLLGC